GTVLALYRVVQPCGGLHHVHELHQVRGLDRLGFPLNGAPVVVDEAAHVGRCWPAVSGSDSVGCSPPGVGSVSSGAGSGAGASGVGSAGGVSGTSVVMLLL